VDLMATYSELGLAVQNTINRFEEAKYEMVSGRLLPKSDSDDPVYPDDSIKAEITFTIPFDYKVPKLSEPDGSWAYDNLPHNVNRCLEEAMFTNHLFNAGGTNPFLVVGARVTETLPEKSRIVAAVVKIQMPEREPSELPKREPKWV